MERNKIGNFLSDDKDIIENRIEEFKKPIRAKANNKISVLENQSKTKIRLLGFCDGKEQYLYSDGSIE